MHAATIFLADPTIRRKEQDHPHHGRRLGFRRKRSDWHGQERSYRCRQGKGVAASTPLREKAKAMGLSNMRVERLDLTDPYDVAQAQAFDVDLLWNNAKHGEAGPVFGELRPRRRQGHGSRRPALCQHLCLFLDMEYGKLVEASAFFDSIVFDDFWQRVQPDPQKSHKERASRVFGT